MGGMTCWLRLDLLHPENILKKIWIGKKKEKKDLNIKKEKLKKENYWDESSLPRTIKMDLNDKSNAIYFRFIFVWYIFWICYFFIYVLFFH